MIVLLKSELGLMNCMFGAKDSDTVMMRVTWPLWIVMLALVSGEVLPGTSPPIRWVSSTGIGDKVLHYEAYALLAGIPTLRVLSRPPLLLPGHEWFQILQDVI